MSFQDIFVDITRRLESAAIKYMVTGSIARNHYLEGDAPQDIDLVVAIDGKKADKLHNLFQPTYFVPEDPANILKTQGYLTLVHVESVIETDLIARQMTDYHLVEFHHKQAVTINGVDTWITRIDDLILSYLLDTTVSESNKGLSSVKALLKHKSVDLDYINSWSKKLGVQNQLSACQ